MGWRRVLLLQLVEDSRWDLVLAAAGAEAGGDVFGTGDFYHPPVHVEDGEGPVSGGAVFVCFDGGAAGAVRQEIDQFGLPDAGYAGAYSSFMMMARSVGVKPMLTQFCLLAAASPSFGEWKMAWPVQSLSATYDVSTWCSH